MKSFKLTLKQGFVLIDETCAKHATVLDGLQSFAGAQLGTNQKIQETLQRLLGQLSVVQQRTMELEKNTSLDWRMQTIEDDLTTLQTMMQGEATKVTSDKTVTQLAQQVQELRQSPLWHEMQVAAAEVHQIKEKFLPVVKDIEVRLAKLERPAETHTTEEQLGILKDRFRPVMQDIEKRLIALESRPTETALSNVSFADETVPPSLTTLIERSQALESKVNNLEPSLSTLHSSISSPLEPPEGLRKGEGSISDPSSTHLLSQEQTFQKRIETLEAWIKSYTGGIPSNTLGFSINEMEGRLLKRITHIEAQLTQISVQELPNRQRELESKVENCCGVMTYHHSAHPPFQHVQHLLTCV